MELTIDIVREWLVENKETAEVKAFLTEITPGAQIDADTVTPFLDTPEGKQLVQPMIDRAVTGGLKTYKEGHYTSDVKAEVAKEILRLNPSETPEAKQIRELRDEVDSEKKSRQTDNLRRQIVEEAAKETIPSWWVDDFSGSTIEEAKVFLGKVKAHDASNAEKVRNELLSAGFKPGASGAGGADKVDLSKLSQAELVAMEIDGTLDGALAG